jgi:hypothetical protein
VGHQRTIITWLDMNNVAVTTSAVIMMGSMATGDVRKTALYAHCLPWESHFTSSEMMSRMTRSLDGAVSGFYA